MGELANRPKPTPITHPNAVGCKITKFIATLDDEDETLVEGYLADYKKISDPALATWFKDVARFPVDKAIVRAHRSGQCCGGRGKVRAPRNRG